MSPPTRNDAAWCVLDFITYTGALTAHEHHLIVTKPDGTNLQVPVADVSVCLFGPEVTLTAGSVLLLAHHHVVTLWCDWKGQPLAATHPWSSNTRVTARHRAQAGLPDHVARRAWAQIVTAKINAQAAALDHLDRPGAHTLRRLTRSRIRNGDPANLEGQAAVTYWPRITADPRFTRGASTCTNAALNYGYGVLRARLIRSILAAGLHPPLALFHRGRGDYFALADDLIEPFRPMVDARATHLAARTSWEPNGPIPAAVRHGLVSLLDEPFTTSGHHTDTSMDAFAAGLAALIEHRGPLTVPTWMPAGAP